MAFALVKEAVGGGLPHFALIGGVHRRSKGALEVVGELFHVGHRPDDPEAAWRVEPGGDPQLDGFVAVDGAPGVRSAQPE